MESLLCQCHPSRFATLAVLSMLFSVALIGCMAPGIGGPASPYQSAMYASASSVPMVQPVVEPTDAQMSCAQLAASSNSLDQVIASESAAPRPAPSAGFTDAIMHTAASMAVGALSSFAPSATYLIPAATGLQQQEITQQEMQAQAQGQVDSQAQMAINNAQQRKMYLATLMQQKNCYAQANVYP
jgi:hypothetical protein